MSVAKFSALITTFLAGILAVHPAVVRAVETKSEVVFEDRASVNIPDAEGRTPLLVATIQKDHAVIKRLLDAGANVSLPDWKGRTPLMIAAMNGDRDLVARFLARSSRPEVVDAEGRSAAHHALSARQFECFKLLLPRMPKLDLPAADGRDLIEMACESGDRELLAGVLSLLPDGSPWTAQARTVLNVALAQHDVDLMRLLLGKYPAPTVDGTNIPLLAQTIVDDDAAMFRTLLAAGVDVNSALPVPCDTQFVDRIKADNLRGYVKADQGITALMLAAGMAKTEYVRALLDAGADKNRQTTRYKMLALYFAARTKEPQIVQMLLGRGPTREELRIEISLASQRASLIKDGVAILQTNISTGRKGFATPAGEYIITDKARSHRSTLYHAEMPYFMRLNCLDFGMHAGVVPNYPASHGCIRLPAAVAEKMFSEVPVGTVVTIN